MHILYADKAENAVSYNPLNQSYTLFELDATNCLNSVQGIVVVG